MAGAAIDQAIFGSSAQKQTGPQLTDLLVQNASYGQPIARCWGQVGDADQRPSPQPDGRRGFWRRLRGK